MLAGEEGFEAGPAECRYIIQYKVRIVKFKGLGVLE